MGQKPGCGDGVDRVVSCVDVEDGHIVVMEVDIVPRMSRFENSGWGSQVEIIVVLQVEYRHFFFKMPVLGRDFRWMLDQAIGDLLRKTFLSYSMIAIPRTLSSNSVHH